MAETFFDKIYKNKTLHTPDVLSCLANLSNDEVFTPPDVVNQMLDLLPQELFADPNATFLDPACKTGVFLREIAKRLLVGLADKIPDLEERIDHIFHKQLYGIAITELTSLLSRRGLYCSKYPNGKYSISHFDDAEGNIRFRRINHTWVGDKCKFCGANKSYDRGDGKETHAYEFIHTLTPEKIFNMKFDVIISNPPYQLSDGGGTGSSAMPIYQYFVEQAMKLRPRYLTMIIPARWFSGGRGVDSFREQMLNDNRIRKIEDYIKSDDCFNGVSIAGGVCFFLWDRDNKGLCKITTHGADGCVSVSERKLLEDGLDTFIRYPEYISIYEKVKALHEESFMSLISANDPYGFDRRVENSYLRIKPKYALRRFDNSIAFYYNGWRKEGLGFVRREDVRKGVDWIDKIKIFMPKACGDHISAFIPEVPSVSTETYLTIGPFKNYEEAKNVLSYMKTKFFFSMLLIIKISQNTMRGNYRLIPMQDFSKPWTDEELYKKYNLSQDEIVFIEKMIKPME